MLALLRRALISAAGAKAAAADFFRCRATWLLTFGAVLFQRVFPAGEKYLLPAGVPLD